MDRWSERDDDDGVQKGPQGRVAREGIGAFIKQDKERVESKVLPITQGKIEIVASKRQQKQQQAAAAMPPPPSRLLAPSRSVTATSMHAHDDTASGCYIQISRGGETVQDVPLTKQCILLGRSQDADVILEHPSSSRQHAIIKFQADSNQWTLIDSGSAHGTFVNTKQLTKGVPTLLKIGVDTFAFGASTRVYMLQRTSSSNTLPKRSSDAVLAQPSKRLKSDGSDNVHTSADRQPQGQGQFAHLVRTETYPARPDANPAASVPNSTSKESSDSIRTKPDFQKFVSKHLKRQPVSSGGLYDMLPPEKGSKVH